MLQRLRETLSSTAVRVELALLLILGTVVGARLVVPALSLAARQGGSLADFLGLGDEDWVIGDGIDLIGTLWTFDFAWDVFTGAQPTDSERLFVPVGMDVGSAQGFAWLDAFFSWPLSWVLGTPAFYNVHVVLTLVASLVALHLAMRGNRGVPWLTMGLATAMASSPFMLQEVLEGRPTQAYLWPHALFLGLAWRLTRPGGNPVLIGLGAGAALAGACLTYWFSGIAMGIVVGIAVVASLLTLPELRRRIVLGGATLCATAIGLVALPAWPMMARVADSDAEWSGHALQPLVVSVLGLDLSFPVMRVRRLDSLWGLLDELLATGLPAVMLVLAAVSLLGLRDNWRRQLPWVLAALLSLTLPLDSLVALGNGDPLPTFKGVMDQLFPPMQRCHQPDRMVVATMAALAMVTVTGLRGVLARLPALETPLAAALGLLAVAGGLLAPSLHPGRQIDASRVFEARSFYEDDLAALPGGLVDVPLEYSTWEYAYQVFHHRGILGGPAYGSEKVHPAEHWAMLQSNSFVQAVEQLCSTGRIGSYHPAHLALLREWGLGVVVVHGSRCPVPAAALDQAFGATGVAGPSGRRAYALPRGR